MTLYETIVNNGTRKRITDILNIKLVETKYIYISLWSLVHFFSGFLFFKLINKYFKKQTTTTKFILLFFGLVLFEIIEKWFMVNTPELFFTEVFVDVVWDIIIGMAGGFLAHYFT